MSTYCSVLAGKSTHVHTSARLAALTWCAQHARFSEPRTSAMLLYNVFNRDCICKRGQGWRNGD